MEKASPMAGTAPTTAPIVGGRVETQAASTSSLDSVRAVWHDAVRHDAPVLVSVP